jgi:hypothetical protein
MIGAIRWDAWYDPADGHVAQAVEKSLGPAEFHYRMPFFGSETGPDSVRINGDSQEIMDQEIAAASNAGIAFWAFCSYAPADPMSNALRLYLSSKRRGDLPFCLFGGVESSIDYFKPQTEYQLSLMREPCYMKVLDGRPLFFIFGAPDDQLARDGGVPKLLEWIRHMRAELQKSGHGNPYFVLSEGNPKRAAQLCLGPFGGAPYQVLVQNVEAHWDKLAAAGLNVVPNIMSGWDTRPRLRTPVPWNDQKTPPKPDHYYQQATPEEIACHAADAIRWIKAHPARTPANIGLIYAWNECDEGFGALVPTYEKGNSRGNDARLRALTPVLKNA